MSEQKRLDRPELERKIDLEALAGMHRVIPFLKDYCDGEPIDAYLTSASIAEILKKILAVVIPDIEEAYKEGYEKARSNLNSPEVLAIATEALEEAKKQEGERIRKGLKDAFDKLFKVPVPDFIPRDLLVRFYDEVIGQALKETEGGKEV